MGSYQTRISDYGEMDRSRGYAPFAAYADLQRKDSAQALCLSGGGPPCPFVEAGVPASLPDTVRTFNGVRVSLEGKTSAVKQVISAGMNCNGASPGPRDGSPKPEKECGRTGCIKNGCCWRA